MNRQFFSRVAMLVGAALVISGFGPAAPANAAEPAKPAAPAAKKVDFPQKGKPITIIVPFAAGATTDAGTRLLVPLLQQALGVPVQVLNRPGASTQVGTTELARARPDGYTLGIFAFMAGIVSYLDAERKAVYSRKDFQPVAHYLVEPQTLSVRPESPYKTTKELLDAAKARPHTLTAATVGLMANTHLQMLQLEQLTGARFNYVHFDGGGAQIGALLGGHADLALTTTPNIRQHFRAGTLRVLGVADREESKFLPGIQTFESQGYKFYEYYSYGLAAPGGTPREIVNILSGAAKKAMESNELKKKVDDLGSALRYMDPAQFEAYWVDLESRGMTLVKLARQ